MAAAEPPAEPASDEAAQKDDEALPIDPSLFDKIKFKPNSGMYVFVPKNVLGDRPER